MITQFTPNSLNKTHRYLTPLIALILGGILLSQPPKHTQAQGNNPNAITVRADIQEANSETGIVTARGNVQIFYPAKQIQATSTQAQYFSKERRLVLSGNVYVLQEGNSMRAETITYLIDEGRFVASPPANRQVESTYIVPPEASPSPSPRVSPSPSTPPPLPNASFQP